MHFVQWHHIFPKALLKEAGYDSGEIREIANMSFVSGRTNHRFGKKPPAGYLAATMQALLHKVAGQ